jgi:hypothetical protein
MKTHIRRELRNCGEFMDFIRNVAEDRLPNLPPDEDMTAMDVLGEELWAQLSRGEQRLAGKCLKRLVEDNALPLERVAGIHEYPLLYRKR